MPLVLYLSKELGKPVKWVDDRRGLMTSTVQGRDQKMTAIIAGTRDGKITALKCISYANLGAYPSTIGPGVATAMVGRNVTGVYDIEHAFCEIYAAFTNRVPLGAQRGSGRAEATFMLERMIDPTPRNRWTPPKCDARTWYAPSRCLRQPHGLEYDSGDYPAALDQALDRSTTPAFGRRRQSQPNGANCASASAPSSL